MSGWRERQAKKVEAGKTKSIELNEINFPSLTAGAWSETPKTEPKKTGKSFASLAKEWNEHAEQEKIRSDAKEEQRRIEQYEIQQIRKRHATAYNFGSSHAREEDTYYETQDDEYIPDHTPDTSVDWRTISKKVRKTRTNFNSPAFQPQPSIQEDETPWNDEPYE